MNQLLLCENLIKILIAWIIILEVQTLRGIANNHNRKVSRYGRSINTHVVCPHSSGIYPHPKDCSKYLNCVNSFPYVLSCGSGTLFNPVLLNCDIARNVNCFVESPNAEPATSSSTTPNPTQISILQQIEQVQNKIENVIDRIPFKTSQTKVIKKKESDPHFSNDPRALCLKPTGQFPYPKDCSKYVNCLEGRALLSDCPPGLHFDASVSSCGWPGNVICASRTLVSESSISSVMLRRNVSVPFPGQRLRLRRGGAPYVGYLQAWFDGDWRPVVVSGNPWRAKNAICQSLGFTRGAHSETRGLVYGWPKKGDAFEKVLSCRPDEEDPLQCHFQLMAPEKISKSLAGIRCHRNSVSECPPGWHRWGQKCYKVNTKVKATQSNAKSMCEKENGRLLSVASQKENDFVSNLLASSSNSNSFHSGGLTFKLQGEQFWLWRGTNTTLAKAFQFTKWWPGWERKHGDKEFGEVIPDDFPHATTNISKSQCIFLQDRFPYPETEENQPAKYFFWKLGDCERNLNFVCERDPLPIGCIVGAGASYNGTANTTASGEPCLMWRTLGETYRGLSKLRTLRENFCLNPDGDDLPWCFVAGKRIEFCDIPRCPRPEPLKVEIETPKCSHGSMPCKEGKCIYLKKVCDGKKDCQEGEDEDDCPDYSGLFRKHSGAMLNESQVETWVHSPKPTCAIRCVQAKSFQCHSFNYEESTSTCILNKNNAGTIGNLIINTKWEYNERLDLAPDCNEYFNCTDFKCIPQTKVCDGRRDCAGGEDESNCLDLSNFELRLVNGSGTHEGRVETKVGGEWGPVCDDMWGIEDGNVVCRQLGYTRGAKRTYTNSHFGNGDGNYMMDDLNCNGNEETLSSCDFGGWKESDCDPNESAGVTCYRERDECSASQWECKNRRCIEFIYFCDTIDDCGDNSDEQIGLCMSSIALRLESSSSSSLERNGAALPDLPKQEGRVEVRYKGIWGTICDDDISIAEGHVICQMLGWKGALEVLKDSSFGPGSGPIWIDGLRCQGVEESITECHHEKWGSTNCDHTEDLGVKCTNDRSFEQKMRSAATTTSSLPSSLLNFLPSKCGIRFVDDNPKTLLSMPKIVDGYVPVRGAHPWIAGIRRKTAKGSTHQCGASILTEDLLITAAHCLWKYTISTYFIRTGDYNNEERDALEKEWMLENIIIHPKYDKGVPFNNDIALVKIKRKKGRGIKFNNRVQPICLPSEDFSYPSELNCSVAGWGTLSSTLGYSRILQSTSLPILTDTVCKEDHVYGDTRISEGMFCAGYLEGGIDTCQGDSGGPLVCLIDGRYTAVGITSWGHGCARANKPGVYTKLTYYLNWIYNVTQQVFQ